MSTTLKVPPKVTLTLSEMQRRNLLAFLARVPLKGNEAKAYVELTDLLKQPTTEHEHNPDSHAGSPGH
jgi:hypothetical protein